MKVSKLIQLLAVMDGDADLQFVSKNSEEILQVDDIAFLVAPANEEKTAFYLYSEEAAEFCEK